ncbi:MAG: S1-like domain-containing RNA-binding protein [Melioribacteraceae bacterium]|nr:S1-like domain-containing RNA-binding protein [Melioribacteraceae bacterium]
MSKIGRLNRLKVIREVEFGVYLDGEIHGEILLPRSDMLERYNIDDEVEVFIYFDSEDRIIATTKRPKLMVGEFGHLRVVSITNIGAFLDWGLTKDLFVPFNEQKEIMEEGREYLVHAFYDEKSNRIAASSRVERYSGSKTHNFIEEQSVDLIICSETDLGFKAIINNANWGVIYKNEVFQKLNYGQKIKGYIKKVRNDGKIDLCLEKPGPQKIDGLSQAILDKLIEREGFLPITDKTSPEIISKMFGVSKKTYKKAIGALYKRKHIILEKDGIRLIAN